MTKKTQLDIARILGAYPRECAKGEGPRGGTVLLCQDPAVAERARAARAA